MRTKILKFGRYFLPVLILLILLSSYVMVFQTPVEAADVAHFWVNGTGAWSDVNHWDLHDGGAGGDTGVPDNDDSVFFTALSAAGAGQVVTIDAAATCGSMNWTGQDDSMTLAGSAALTIYDNLTLIAAMAWTKTGTTTLSPTDNSATITTNGLTIGNGSGSFVLNKAGGTFTLADDLTFAGSYNFTLTAGTLAAGANDLILNGTAHTINGTFTVTTFTRTGTATNANTLTLTSGTTLTCTTFAMIGNSRANQLLVQSSTLGTAATVTATNWTGTNNADLMDITATNAVDFSAAGLNILTIGNAGGNTGITFPAAAAQTYTNTGDAKASTAANWTSRIPLVGIDDVTIGATITYDMPRMGKSVTFTGSPVVTLSQGISFYGSYTLVTGMTYTTAGFGERARGRGNYTLTSSGKTLGAFRLDAPTGTLTLTDALVTTTSNGLIINAGTFNDGGKSVTAMTLVFTGDLTRSIIKSGTLTLNSTATGVKWSVSGTNYTLTDTGTTILTNSGVNAQTFAGAGLTYNNVTVQGAGNYALTVTGNNTFNVFKSDDSVANKTIVGNGTTQTVGDFQKDNGGTGVTTITNGTWTKHGSLVGVGGTFTGSPVYFDNISESIECTVTGTATVTLPYGVTGTATSGVGGAVVTASPKALVAGVNTITVTTGGNNLFTVATTSVDSVPISLNYMSITGSTAVPANVWYAGDTGAGGSTDGGGNTAWLFDDPALTTTTQAATGVSMTAAGVTSGTFNGTVTTDLDGTPIITTLINYGLTALYGSVTANVVYYDNGAFTGIVPGNLTPGATYHYRGVATNGNAGSPFNGGDQSFAFTMPTVTTSPATISGHHITLNGNVSNMGVASSTSVFFQYGVTPALGSTTAAVNMVGVGSTSAIIVAPSSDIILYYRTVAQNGAVTVTSATTNVAVPAAVGGNMMRTLLRVVLAGAIIVGVMILSRVGGISLLVSGVIGLLAYTIVDIVIGMFI